MSGVESPAEARWLLEKGLSLDTSELDSDENFLFYLNHNNAKLIRFYISEGLDVNKVNFSGKTPLFSYTEVSVSDFDDENDYERHLECIQTLVDAGVDLNVVDEDGHTAVWYAENIDIIRILYKKWIESHPEDAIPE